MKLLGALFSISSKNKKDPTEEDLLYSNIKKVLIFSQNKSVLIFEEMETPKNILILSHDYFS